MPYSPPLQIPAGGSGCVVPFLLCRWPFAPRALGKAHQFCILDLIWTSAPDMTPLSWYFLPSSHLSGVISFLGSPYVDHNLELHVAYGYCACSVQVISFQQL